MDRNERQGHWLLDQGLIDRPTLARAYAATVAQPEGPDLGAWLHRENLLEAAALDRLRVAVLPVTQSERRTSTFRQSDEVVAGPDSIPTPRRPLPRPRYEPYRATPPGGYAPFPGPPAPGDRPPPGRFGFAPDETTRTGPAAALAERPLAPAHEDDQETAKLSPEYAAQLARSSEIVPGAMPVEDFDPTLETIVRLPTDSNELAPELISNLFSGDDTVAETFDPRHSDDLSNSLSGSLEATPTVLRPGSRFRDYLIVREISRGAMGVVFLALDKDDREVALKFMLNDGSDETETARFRREVEALIRLKHSNIVGIQDFGEDELGRLFYAMEYVRGTDLKTVLRESLRRTGEPPSVESMIEVFSSIADALRTVHAAGLVHRDLKPQNILIEENTGRAVLADFGILKSHGRSGSESGSRGLTRTGEVIGTPAYMSPEQFAPADYPRGTSDRTDVWGFCATFYEALTGRPPFEARTMVELFRAVVHKPIEDPELRLPEAPAEVVEVIRLGLTRDPDERPDMVEIAELLACCRAQPEPEPGSKLALPIAAVLALSTLFIPALLPSQPPRISLDRDALPTVTPDSELTLTGRIRNGSGPVLVNGTEATLDETGRFKARVALQEGLNTVLVITGDGAAQQRESLEVRSDPSAPQIVLDGRSSEPDHDAELIAEVDESDRLSGSVKDSTEVTLTYNGEPVVLGDEAEFHIFPTEQPEPEKSRLTAVDAAGNSRTLKLEVWSRTALKRRAERRALAALRARVTQQEQAREAAEAGRAAIAHAGMTRLSEDLGLSPADARRLARLASPTAWRGTTASERSETLACVRGVLGDAFAPLPSGRFESRDGVAEIGRFEHLASGLIFHLAPGSVRTVRVWRAPVTTASIARLRDLVRALPSVDALASSIALEPFPGFTQHWCRRLGVTRTTPEEAAELQKAPLNRRFELYWEICRRVARDIVYDRARLNQLRVGVEANLAAFRKQIPSRELTVFVPPMLVMPTELREDTAARLGMPGAKAPDDNVDRPVAEAAWSAVDELARRLGDHIRVPTLTEWRHLAMAGTCDEPCGPAGSESFEASVHAGRTLLDPVQGVTKHRLAGNGYGLSDMIGNSAEYCDLDGALWRRAFGEILPEVFRTHAFVAGGGTWLVAELQSARRADFVQRSNPRTRAGVRFVRPLD